MDDCTKRKVGLVSLGCSKNLVDSEVMLGQLSQGGYEIVDGLAEADVIVVNTCAFIGPAKEESIETILDMVRFKEDGKCSSLVVTGCMAQRYSRELIAEIPEIDAVLGVNQYPQIAGLLNDLQKDKPRVRDIRRVPLPTDFSYPRIIKTPAHSVYLKIAEGCDRRCTFCIIPAIRGKQASRTIDSLVDEARGLAAQGALELNLISQDTTWYGKDLQTPASLPDLLRALNQVDGLRWIRPLYNHPVRFTDEIIEAIAELDHVCNYIDMPLQHISNRMLKSMNRETTRGDIESLLVKARNTIADLTFRTTFIVGFPGETDDDFEQLYDFVGESRFDRLGVFQYSPEEHTPAFRYDEPVAEELTQERHDRLMALQRDISLSRNQSIVGKVVDVLVDEAANDGAPAIGRTEADAPEVDNEVLLYDDTVQQGQFISVLISDALEYDLVGDVTPHQSHARKSIELSGA